MKAEQQISNEFAEYKRVTGLELEGLRARVQELEVELGKKVFVFPDPSAQPVHPPPPAVTTGDEDEDAPEDVPDFTIPEDAPSADAPPIAGVDVPISVDGGEGDEDGVLATEEHNQEDEARLLRGEGAD